MGLAALFAAAGIYLGVVGAEKTKEAVRLSQHGRTVAGTVVDRHTEFTPGPQGGTSHEMTVTYTAGDGSRYRITAAGSDPIGSSIPVTYDPAAPEHATLSLPWKWFGAAARIAVALANLVAPVLIVVNAKEMLDS
ncbi:DUF3592 domain-containing protein [Streptomyces sp. HNM0663]|uniref:DUF3592 domain-containing protein n=1 Tax=Streptomyces chengmaiensis TaxID=3040919 RepID=A0ABT6HJV8_9ACTN|nr:DUF3592 domain-containing protein [Streptomyces chengmaiensis]MDH2389038.1 DUF3592 domain-containing protein [Streptomyces chengmaiensis]